MTNVTGEQYWLSLDVSSFLSFCGIDFLRGGEKKEREIQKTLKRLSSVTVCSLLCTLLSFWHPQLLDYISDYCIIHSILCCFTETINQLNIVMFAFFSFCFCYLAWFTSEKQPYAQMWTAAPWFRSQSEFFNDSITNTVQCERILVVAYSFWNRRREVSNSNAGK